MYILFSAEIHTYLGFSRGVPKVLLIKSDNIQYNMLVRWVGGTNDSSTKRLMFQVLFFFHNFWQNSLFVYFYFL